jgi:hypothetical protein
VRTPGRVSDQAVRRATGRGWDDWLAVLDAAGAARWDHPRLATLQLTLLASTSGRTAVGVHLEKLADADADADADAREQALVHWRGVLDRLKLELG